MGASAWPVLICFWESSWFWILRDPPKETVIPPFVFKAYMCYRSIPQVESCPLFRPHSVGWGFKDKSSLVFSSLTPVTMWSTSSFCLILITIFFLFRRPAGDVRDLWHVSLRQWPLDYNLGTDQLPVRIFLVLITDVTPVTIQTVISIEIIPSIVY